MERGFLFPSPQPPYDAKRPLQRREREPREGNWPLVVLLRKNYTLRRSLRA